MKDSQGNEVKVGDMLNVHASIVLVLMQQMEMEVESEWSRAITINLNRDKLLAHESAAQKLMEADPGRIYKFRVNEMNEIVPFLPLDCLPP